MQCLFLPCRGVPHGEDSSTASSPPCPVSFLPALRLVPAHCCSFPGEARSVSCRNSAGAMGSATCREKRVTLTARRWFLGRDGEPPGRDTARGEGRGSGGRLSAFTFSVGLCRAEDREPPREHCWCRRSPP